MQNDKHNSLKQYYWLIPLITLLAYCIYIVIQKPIGDFGNYYYGSKFLAQGNWGAWIYEPAKFNLAIYDLGERNFFLNYTPVPPLSALLYLPLTFLNAVTAKLIWNILNSLLLIITLCRLKKQYSIHYLCWYLLPLFFFIPIKNNIQEGQSYFLLLFLIAEGFIQYNKGNKWTMAILWALSIHLKISPVIILLFLVFNKDFKATMQLALVTVLLLIISIPILTPVVWLNYITTILPRLFTGEINYTYALSYQSAQVLLKTLFVPDVLGNKNAWLDSPSVFEKSILLFNVIIIGVTIFIANSKIHKHAKFGIWIIASMLISGYGNSFGLLLLLLPAIYFYPLLQNHRYTLFIFGLLLIITNNIPFYKFSDLIVPLQFPRLYAMLGLFTIAVVISNVRIKWYYFLFPLLIIAMPIGTKDYKQNYLFKKEEALLIYDFSFSNNQLAINCFDKNGPYEKLIPLDFEIHNTNYVTQHNTMPIPQKKSCIVNDSLLVFLSDENRGVGFYTLRKSLITHEQE